MSGGYYPRLRTGARDLDQIPAHTFDGKRLRKKVQRKTVDYFSSTLRHLEDRLWMRDPRIDCHKIQPDLGYVAQLQSPHGYQSIEMSSVCTKWINSSMNKNRYPVNICKYSPDGRRLLTGLSSGEITLWNALTFNFETLLQAHEDAIRSMVWSNDGQWMVTSDKLGVVKYWQANMNNVVEFQAHNDVVREVCISPTDKKLLTCADDKTLKVFDFATQQEEVSLLGHRWDVKCCDWHPSKGLVASGSKDKLVKLWDPRSGQDIYTIHAHKNTIMKLKFNSNGNWFVTASRDQMCRLFDLRHLKEEVKIFRGHTGDVQTVAWHPMHEKLFVSGCLEGSIKYWSADNDKCIGSIDEAHDSHVFALDWHPLGHVIASSSNDHATKFWTRNRPGDDMKDKYNLNIPEDELNEDGTVMTRVDANNLPGSNSFQPDHKPTALPGLNTTMTIQRNKERYADIPNLSNTPSSRPQQNSIHHSRYQNMKGNTSSSNINAITANNNGIPNTHIHPSRFQNMKQSNNQSINPPLPFNNNNNNRPNPNQRPPMFLPRGAPPPIPNGFMRFPPPPISNNNNSNPRFPTPNLNMRPPFPPNMNNYR